MVTAEGSSALRAPSRSQPWSSALQGSRSPQVQNSDPFHPELESLIFVGPPLLVLHRIPPVSQMSNKSDFGVKHSARVPSHPRVVQLCCRIGFGLIRTPSIFDPRGFLHPEFLPQMVRCLRGFRWYCWSRSPNLSRDRQLPLHFAPAVDLKCLRNPATARWP